MICCCRASRLTIRWPLPSSSSSSSSNKHIHTSLHSPNPAVDGGDYPAAKHFLQPPSFFFSSHFLSFFVLPSPPQRPLPRRASCCGARGRRRPTRTSTSKTFTSGMKKSGGKKKQKKRGLLPLGFNEVTEAEKFNISIQLRKNRGLPVDHKMALFCSAAQV